MANNPVGITSALPINTSSARGLDTTAHKTDALRVVAVGESEVITLGACRNQKVIGITTGATTTIDFPEGTGSPFQVGDAVSLTVTGQTDYNFTHQIVSSVDNSAGVDGFYSTRIVVDHDSSTGNPAALIPTNSAELRGSFMVAALGTGSGTLHYQQVQTSKGANG